MTLHFLHPKTKKYKFLFIKYKQNRTVNHTEKSITHKNSTLNLYYYIIDKFYLL